MEFPEILGGNSPIPAAFTSGRPATLLSNSWMNSACRSTFAYFCPVKSMRAVSTFSGRKPGSVFLNR
jgi:hypothetical protein